MIVRTELETADLAALLDHSGTPGPLNLRPEGAAAPLSGSLTARLAKAGLAQPGNDELVPSPAGRIVADVLSSPRCYLQLVLWNDETEGRMRIAFPASPAAGAGVIVNQSQGRVELQGFVDDQALTDLTSPFLSILPDNAPSFDASLSFAQAAVFGAILDMTVSDRRDRPQSNRTRSLDAENIAEWLNILWAGSARTSISGQIFALSLTAAPPQEEIIGKVLEELTEAGLLTIAQDAGSHEVGAALRGLGEVLLPISGGFDLERIDRPERGPLTGRLVHVLAGPAGAVVLELAGADRIRIRAADRRMAASLTASLIAGTIPGPERSEPEISPDQARGAVGHRFCARCGKPIEPSWRFCKACGSAIGGQKK